MRWVVQVVLQAALVATATVVILWSPWLIVKVFFAVFLIFFLISIGRNPIAFWRRLARMVVLLAIPSVISGVTFRIHGQGYLPNGAGNMGFNIEQANVEALPLIIVVLLCAIAFDIATYWFQQRTTNQSAFKRSTNTAPISLGADQSIELFHTIMISTKEQAITLIGAKLIILGLLPTEIDCSLHTRWDENENIHRPVDHEKQLVIAPHSTSIILVSAQINRGLLAGWIILLTGSTLRWMRLAHGEIHPTVSPEFASTPLPVRFVRRP